MDKENFKKEAMKSLNDLFAKIDELDAKKDNIEADAKAEYEETLSVLKSKKEHLQTKYDELNNASEEKWDEVKSVFSAAIDSFEDGFSKIASLF